MNEIKHKEIINKVFPAINECWKIQKQMGQTPSLILEGMVLGYLLGKGFTLEESSIGKMQWLKTVNSLMKQYPGAEEIWGKGTNVRFSSEGKYEKVD